MTSAFRISTYGFYELKYFSSLLRVLSSLIAHTTALSKPPPLIILAFKEDDFERSLWDRMKNKLGVTLEKADECAGSGGAPVEIWLGIPNPDLAEHPPLD